jgi:tRNA pseudouridine55 synthase
MTVSSGTYVRTIVHDIGAALGSAAHVVRLQRTRQGEFALDGEGQGLSDIRTIDWGVFERALEQLKTDRSAGKDQSSKGGTDSDGKEEEDEGCEETYCWQEWEEQLLANIKST